MHNPLSPETPALILIDIQKAFDEPGYFGGERNNPDAENNARRLLVHWRRREWPLFHIQHCSVMPGSPLREGEPGNAFKEVVQPWDGELVIKKSVNSAFIGTDLRDCLAMAGIRQVVIAGLTTEHCVSTTARMAGNFGFGVYVAADATAAFCKMGLQGESIPAETVWQVALAELNGEFATVLPTDEVLRQFS